MHACTQPICLLLAGKKPYTAFAHNAETSKQASLQKAVHQI
jgi:hypothetical protein